MSPIGGNHAIKKICLGKTPQQMLIVDKEAKKDAMALYKKIAKRGEKDGDPTARTRFNKITFVNGKHHNTFFTLFETYNVRISVENSSAELSREPR